MKGVGGKWRKRGGGSSRLAHFLEDIPPHAAGTTGNDWNGVRDGTNEDICYPGILALLRDSV